MYNLKLILVLIMFHMLSGTSVFAQIPNLINYQGVALNTGGSPITNTNISVRIQFHDGGSLFYTEDRLVPTDNYGHFAFQIGSPGAFNILGTVENLSIDFLGEKTMSVYLDPNGGSNFTLMGTDTLATVPHSYLAKSAIYADTLNLPYQRDNFSTNSFVINNNNTAATSNAIIGRTFGGNTNNVGVLGEVGLIAPNGTGVRGRSYTSGSIAVEGISNSGTAVRAKSSSTGTALIAENTSVTGKALDVNGNVKIAGGNTNPSNGAVLTSDASGNATWKAPLRVAFEARTTSWTNYIVPEATWYDLQLDYEVFDDGNVFNPSGAATDPATFTAPADGVYSISAYTEISISSTVNNLEDFEMALYKNGSLYIKYTCNAFKTEAFRSNGTISFVNTLKLNAGDKLKVKLWQTNTGSLLGQLQNTYFTGHLVYAY